MTTRWMEGAGRLDTSRGSRFMRAEADLTPAAQQAGAVVDEGPASEALNSTGAAGDPNRDELTLPSQRRQVRASLRPAHLRRNAG